MRQLAIAFMALVFLAGCGAMIAEQHRLAVKRSNAVAEQCKEKRLAGELDGHVASVRCSNPSYRKELAAANYPYMDLIELFLSYRLALAKKIDDGEVTQEEAELEFAQLRTQITAEEMRRNAMLQAAHAQRMAGISAVMQSMNAWQTSTMPQRTSVHCYSLVAGSVTCY